MGTTMTKADYDRQIESYNTTIKVKKEHIEHYKTSWTNNPAGRKVAIQNCKDDIARCKAEIARLKEKRKNAPK